MKHLFIINPVAKRVKGRVDAVKQDITDFFIKHPDVLYDVRVTEWSRDAVTFIRQYLQDSGDSIVRVHSIGGTGTQFEVLNGIAGEIETQAETKAELASHPYGKSNSFLRYFGTKNIKRFASLRRQVFGDTVGIDMIRCSNNRKGGSVYGLCYGLSGIDSSANALCETWLEKGLPAGLCYPLAGVRGVLKGKLGQWYSLGVDDRTITGDYATIMIANAPCYGFDMHPAVDAHPDDGLLHLYTFKKVEKTTALRSIPHYTYGRVHKLTRFVTHLTAKKIHLSSGETMCVSLDGEIFYRTHVSFSVVPNGVRFVLPEGVDLAKLPLIYNKPKMGLRGENFGSESRLINTPPLPDAASSWIGVNLESEEGFINE
jgi:diacylglycerol kinase family enzyme